MLHYCELFPCHSTAVSENNIHSRLVTALTPKRGSGSEVEQVGTILEQKSCMLQVSCENLCPTLLVDLSPFTTVVGQSFHSFAVNICTQAVNKQHARSLPQSTLFNLSVMSIHLLKYCAIYI